MAHQDGEDVYATLLTNDTYLPGALVLAHSLRDAGTTKKLAVLVTLDTVATEVVAQLRNVFDYVLPVPRIRNEAAPGNLNLMNRPDLHSAFTKINLWKLLQFRKIVYIDADVVAYRAPDELFALEHAFAAAPDIGWPDLFNTGVMVVTPDLGEYNTLSAMAERGVSFDGADQGLLNMHFQDGYHRLPFTYNVTPSAHYQYIPAYRHFQSSINMVHFIGSGKPWFQGRQASHGGAYDEMVGQWWAVYDRHYRAATSESGVSTSTAPEIIQYFVAGEYNPTVTYKLTDRLTYGQESWDAQRQSPPANTMPEAMNFPQAHYEMSRDTAPFVPPQRYPSPPRHMGYEVPRDTYQKPAPIFPWEANQPAPSRTFVEPVAAAAPPPAPVPAPAPASKSSSPKIEPTTPTVSSVTVSSSVVQEQPPSDPWASFTRSNAWDGVPQIERYVNALQKQQGPRVKGRARVPETPTFGSPRGSLEQADDGVGEQRGLLVTDFPSEAERPSLPVTPAPIRGTTGWGGDDIDADADGERVLPAAQGVPQQADWDPATQLQILAQEQSRLLLERLGHQDGQEGTGGGGSEGMQSPTYIAHAPVVSPKPVKPGNLETSSVLSIYDHSSRASSINDGTTNDGTMSDSTEGLAFEDMRITEPAYRGPGIVFEKDEGAPAHGQTAALPSEEELDVLVT